MLYAAGEAVGLIVAVVQVGPAALEMRSDYDASVGVEDSSASHAYLADENDQHGHDMAH